MPSTIAPVIEPRRGVHCVSGHPSLEEVNRQGHYRSRTLSDMDPCKRRAIVLERDESLSSNPQLAQWSSEVKKTIFSPAPHEQPERRSRHHNRVELFCSNGNIRRDTLRRKPVPPIPPELEYYAQTNHRQSSSDSSYPRTMRPQSLPRTSGETSSAGSGSPKSIESDLRTLVDDDDDWDFVSSDIESDMDSSSVDLHGVPLDVFITLRTKAAREEASRRIAHTGCKKNITCSRDGCNSVLLNQSALTSHLVNHDLEKNLACYGENVIYTCQTKNCRCAFPRKEQLDKHRIYCGWSVQPIKPSPPPKNLLNNMKTGITKHIHA
ncbi:hypothetical protein QCA50_014309 [Cerrena zonata]|uniref:C2H2-type domain-containing protein n=1 Tax=Cerrena zonata TaxID=2478898 RepID=A0AAW0FWC9_9APHY